MYTCAAFAPKTATMINAISSMLPSLAGLIPAGPSAGAGGLAGFGPDFLLGALSSRSQSAGASYDANGQLLLSPEGSAQSKAREEALTEAKQKLKGGDPAGAREAANRVLHKNPGDAIAAAYVGRTYMAEGDYESAVKYFSRAASGSDIEQIQTDLRAAQTLAKGPTATIEAIQRLMRQSGTSREGAQLAVYFLDKHPENLDARFELVGFYQRQGQVNLAGAELTDALATVSPDDLDRFISRVEKFSQSRQDDPAAQDLLAQAYAKAQRFDDAQAAFQKALDLSGDNLEFQVQLKKDFAGTFISQARGEKARGNDDAARQLYEKGLAVFSTDEAKGELSDLELERGERELRSGRVRLALEALDNARAYLPGTVSDDKKRDLIAAYERLAGRLNDVGDLKSAVAARNGAFLLDPANDTRKRALADAYDVYGVDLLARQDYRMAARQFRAALNYFHDDANYAAHLSDAESHL